MDRLKGQWRSASRLGAWPKRNLPERLICDRCPGFVSDKLHELFLEHNSKSVFLRSTTKLNQNQLRKEHKHAVKA